MTMLLSCEVMTPTKHFPLQQNDAAASAPAGGGYAAADITMHKMHPDVGLLSAAMVLCGSGQCFQSLG